MRFSLWVKNRRGFSLIELLLVIGITAILATSGGLAYRSFHQKVVIDKNARQMVAEIRNVITKAQTQEEGTNWGIKFVKTGDRDYYQILKGSEDTVYKTIYLHSMVQFGDLFDPDDPGTATTTFSEMFQGGPTLDLLEGIGVIEILSTGKNNLMDTITISRVGVVSRTSSYEQDSVEEGGDEFPCGPGDRIRVCHISNTNWQTITVDVGAVDAHIEHGDYCGVCVD